MVEFIDEGIHYEKVLPPIWCDDFITPSNIYVQPEKTYHSFMSGKITIRFAPTIEPGWEGYWINIYTGVDWVEYLKQPEIMWDWLYEHIDEINDALYVVIFDNLYTPSKIQDLEEVIGSECPWKNNIPEEELERLRYLDACQNDPYGENYEGPPPVDPFNPPLHT